MQQFARLNNEAQLQEIDIDLRISAPGLPVAERPAADQEDLQRSLDSLAVIRVDAGSGFGIVDGQAFV